MRAGAIVALVHGQYKGVADLLGACRTTYGGFVAIMSSPYLHAALVLLLPTYGVWSKPGWWDIALAVLPNLVSFSLAGYAMLMGLGDEQFKAYLKDQDGERGPLLALSATFSHFIVIQTAALFLALIAKSRPLSTLHEALPWLPLLPLPGKAWSAWGTQAFWGVSFLACLCALTSIVAATMSVFRMSRWLNQFGSQE